jgi:hypothetical protein
MQILKTSCRVLLILLILQRISESYVPVKVEFLRLAYVDAPITEDIEIWNNGEGFVSGLNYGINVNPNGNNPNGVNALSTGLSVGENNISNGIQSGVIGGEFNFIGGNNGV